MLRVAWVTSGFSKDERDYGGSSAMHCLARELSKQPDLELTIFSLYYPPNQPEYKFYNAKVFSFGGMGINSKFDKIKAWNRCIKKFGEENKKSRFDIIHSMWAGEPGYVASRLSKNHNIPLIANVCGGELAEIREINYGSRLKFWQKYFVDKTFQYAVKIVAGSDYIIEKVKSYYNEDIVKKILKIPFGVDESAFKPSSPDIDENTKLKLINLASAVPVKNHMLLLKAFRIVTEQFPDASLHLYGRYLSRLNNKIKELKLERSVSLNEFIDYEDVPKILNSCGIFVLSSFYESQNMSIIEAAFCGIPVVSTAVGSAEEVTENIVSSLSEEELTEKIINVINNYELEKRKALDKLPSLQSIYSLKTCTGKFIELYRNMI
ncbi:MAG: glycosyltransferase family 4 protein [Ignavibacteria bacterium]